MLGLLLRSELIQSSAVRTWNCVTNIAQLVWYKLNSLRRTEMPRSRRRHHSRSRSRSHSHDRDREVKRRRIDSHDSHHRRSVSDEEASAEEVRDVEIEETPEIPAETKQKKQNTLDCFLKKGPKQATPQESLEVSSESEEEDSKETLVKKESDEEMSGNDEELVIPKKQNLKNEPCTSSAKKVKDDIEKESGEELKSELKSESNEELVIKDEPSSAKKIIDDIEKESDEELKTESKSESDEELVTPKKQNPRDEPGSSSKKSSAKKVKMQEDREKRRKEALEQKEKLKQEKQAQKIKEKQEKEEQRKKEKLEKEEQKRKEKEEKEEQKRKEREEKEEQKRKEREEKEEQKRKEREEKEEQKRKEREEKEDQKRKERDEKLEREKKKKEKESAAFVSFFVSRKSATFSEPPREASSAFMPFEIKAEMRLAPTCRAHLSDEQKTALTSKLETPTEGSTYLDELKHGKVVRRSLQTWPVEDNDVILLEESELGERVEEQPKRTKLRAKLLKFDENRRPAYFGTWRKQSRVVGPRKPFALDKDCFDYEVDSDDDWEEEEPGESLKGSDDEEKDNESDEYEVDNEFFVPHGYLSDEEVENEENVQLTPETQKAKLKLLQMEFEQEMKSKTERIKPRLIGCIWENKLKPKIQDAIHAFLEERMIILTAPIAIKKRDLSKNSKSNTGTKNSTPSRKQLPKDFIPDFLRLVHGNTTSRNSIVNEFSNYLSNKNVEFSVTKVGLNSQLNELAKWKRCPEKGAMFNKFCWFVNEDTRSQYNLNLALPNKWSSEEVNAKKKLQYS